MYTRPLVAFSKGRVGTLCESTSFITQTSVCPLAKQSSELLVIIFVGRHFRDCYELLYGFIGSFIAITKKHLKK